MSESREKSERVVDQTCPDCGGLHFGSVGCSYNRAEPCTNCKQAIAYKQSRAFDQLGRPYHVNCQFLELKVPSATIDDALRLLRKMEGCSRDTAKLICLRNFAKSEREASRRDALEEAAKVCEGFMAECTARPNCHSLDACEVRALKEKP